MEKFEYKTVVTSIPSIATSFKAGLKKDQKQIEEMENSASSSLENNLNEFGLQGWELVNTMPVATYLHGMTGKYISILKRKIPNL